MCGPSGPVEKNTGGKLMKYDVIIIGAGPPVFLLLWK